jgi:pimeloyl-ACP methyl ester carboxylesterase
VNEFADERTGLRVRARDTGTGPALLLIHGLGGGLSNWTLVERALEGDRFGVVSVELPWHGRSRPRRPVTDVEGLIELVAQTAFAAHDGPFIAVGHSLGGAIALGLACRSPRIHQVVLISAHLFALSDLISRQVHRRTHPGLATAWWRAFAAASTPLPGPLVGRLGRSARMQRMLLPPFFNPRLLAADGSLAECLGDHHGGGPRRLLRIIRSLPLTRLAADCPVPATVIAGGRDPLLRPQDGDRLGELMTVQRLDYHAECAHWVIVEKAPAVASVLRELAERVQRGD